MFPLLTQVLKGATLVNTFLYQRFQFFQNSSSHRVKTKQNEPFLKAHKNLTHDTNEPGVNTPLLAYSQIEGFLLACCGRMDGFLSQVIDMINTCSAYSEYRIARQAFSREMLFFMIPFLRFFELSECICKYVCNG